MIFFRTLDGTAAVTYRRVAYHRVVRPVTWYHKKYITPIFVIAILILLPFKFLKRLDYTTYMNAHTNHLPKVEG